MARSKGWAFIAVALLAAWTAAQRSDLAVDLYSAVSMALSRQSNVVVAVLALTLVVLMFLTYKNYFSPRDQVYSPSSSFFAALADKSS